VAMSAAIPMNKGGTACSLPGCAVVALPHLTPTDHGGLGMEMGWAVLSIAGGGGSTAVAARGRGAAR
jgi:hypothetical protein